MNIASYSWSSWLFPPAPGPIRWVTCPKDGVQNEAVSLVCNKHPCGQPLIRWPPWFRHGLWRQCFINGIRAASFIVALLVGGFHVRWPIYSFSALLIFLLLAALLREYPGLDLWSIGAAGALFSIIGLVIFTRFSTGRGVIVVPAVILFIWFIVAIFVYRPSGISLTHAIQAALATIVVGSTVLWILARWHGDSSDPFFLAVIQRLALAGFIGSVAVVGAIDGMARSLPTKPSIRFTHNNIKQRNLPIIPYFPRPVPPGPAGLIVRAVDRTLYSVHVAIVMASMQTLNVLIQLYNGLMAGLYSLAESTANFLRRCFDRMQVIVDAIRRQGWSSVLHTLHTGRHLLLHGIAPAAALIVAAIGAAQVADSTRNYIWSGNLVYLPWIGGALIAIVVAIAIAVSAQTGMAPWRSLRALGNGLVGPGVVAIIFFILLSCGLALGARILHPDPYRIGPVTLSALGLLVLALVYPRFGGGKSIGPGSAMVPVMTGQTLALRAAVAAWAVVTLVTLLPGR